MKLNEIKKALNCRLLVENAAAGTETDILFAHASDLMSDILLKAKPGALLLTGLTNNQAIRTGKIAHVGAVVFVRGKKPSPETITLAIEYNMPLLATEYSMFDACGILYSNGLRGIRATDNEKTKEEFNGG